MKRTVAAVLTFAVLLSAILTSSVDASALGGLRVGKVRTLSSALNVRSAATTDSEILACLDRDSLVTLIQQDSDWWRVKYGDNLYGYCNAKYITELNTSSVRYVNTNGDDLNVRSGAGMSYDVTQTVSKGTPVTVLSQSDSWSNIIYDGVKTGYVKSTYLSDRDASPYPVIQLDVTAYKQTDSRWGYVNLGSSYETIASAGCTTTCLAMSESYRDEDAVYPDTMQSRLGYTSGGSLYWPSDYVTSTDESDWLEAVYSILKSGKPVIVGSKKSSGSQHWVLVTGYEGSSTELSASGFIINDPATASRSDLEELLSDYPIFMKMAYYS